ncbi:MFS transporter [Blastococcus goldschmidtiae]|uniref:MFS transporter n=1 Tax=Blastococcus goldschmidtiae TaxID=3075546 RepID=A0ABU2K842_9ACTN|nr:MFS transporter [Blastococcus sp. DSM 46792]MDT0276362.1 MFS transporter [Blastococcus sp. DSM 46792]
MSRGRPVAAALPYGLLLVGVLVVAANLRALISAVGPVLPVIGEDTGLSPVQLGALAAVPVGAFAVVSPVVHALAQRFGVDRTLFGSMLVLAAGSVIRSLPANAEGPPLFLGTVIIGAAIAVGNVLLPVVVRRDFPGHVPRITGYYIAVQSVVAGSASGLVVPLARATDSWRLALAVWGCPILVALVFLLPRIRSAAHAPTTGEPGPVPLPAIVSIWRSPLAWQVAGYFGLQSTAFYVLLSWLPTVEQDMGVSPGAAGFHLSVFLVVGVASNLAVPRVLTLRGDQRITAVLVPAWTVVAMAGILQAPSLLPFWVALSGLALGASMVVALSLISLRAAGDRTTSRLSSMAQASAYGGVALGLVVAGAIREVFGAGQHLLVYVLVLSLCQLALGARVGRAVQLPA